MKKLRIRDMRPAEPEMMSDQDIAYVQLHERRGGKLVALDEWMHWDPESQQAIKARRPDEPTMRPTGSMKAVDLDCADCGATLVAGKGKVYYLVCGRIADFITDRRASAIAALPTPRENSVIECDRIELTPPE